MYTRKRTDGDRLEKDDSIPPSRKRSKTQEHGTHSKVIMLKGIPVNCTESDLANLASEFGRPAQTLIIAQKRIAFIEMESIEIAESVLEHHNSNPAYIREERISMQFSTRQEITPNSRYSNTNPHFPPSGYQHNTMHQLNPMHQIFVDRQINSGRGMGDMDFVSGGTSSLEGVLDDGQIGLGQEEGLLSSSLDTNLLNLPLDANAILLVTINNMRLPVTIENLYTVFRTFGDVLRIVTFEKQKFQALIEYARIPSACEAKVQLEDKDMFQGCCTLLISFSRMQPPLKVDPANHRSRDFTIQNTTMNPIDPFAPRTALFSTQQPHFTQQTMYPGPPAFSYMPGSTLFGDEGQLMDQQQMPLRNGGEGSVVLVHGLTPEKVSPDILFTLFGIYGDVIRVKIMYNKRHTALVQFVTAEHAARARRYLDKLSLYGNEISIITSKHPTIKLTPPREDDVEILGKDYSGTRLHRFKIPNSRNEQHISPPSNALHLSNLPKDISEEELTDLFSDGEEGGINGIRLFGNERRMAIINFDSTDIAVRYLLLYHNHSLRGNSIKVNFSFRKHSATLPV